MDVDPLEDFPVARFWVPKRLRAPVGVIYRVARTADNIAGDSSFAPAERHLRLADFRAGLDAVAQDYPAQVHPVLFETLARTVKAYALPLWPFYDLVSAFDQDIDTDRYDDWPDLIDYCRRSSNPVGRLMLHLLDASTPQNLADSDALCTALQLVGFLQDVGLDWSQGRIYFPACDLKRFGVTERHFRESLCDDAWSAFMRFEVDHARGIIMGAARFPARMPGRLGLELCGVMQGGLRILEKIERAGYDVFTKRPILKGGDWLIIGVRTLRMRIRGRGVERLASVEIS